VTAGVDVTAPAAAPPGREASHVRFVPRPVPPAWPAAAASREEVLARLTVPPFTLDVAGSQEYRAGGLSLLLSWLEDQPGGSWHDRWLASGAGAAGSRWREVPAAWLAGRGEYSVSRGRALCGVLHVAICADLVRPSLPWFTAAVMRGGALAACMSATRDPAGFARLAGACASEKVPAAARVHIMHRAAVIMGAKGGMLAGITAGDVLELVTAEEDAHASPMPHAAGFYQMLHQTGILGPGAPPVLRELRAAGQRTPEELIDRYRLSCRPARDLLVEYLKERQPALDYSSLRSLAAALGGRFWKDLEDHHPGIDSLHLPTEVAEAWKQRLRNTRKTVTTAGGGKSEVTAERISYRQCLTPVRAFYLDLSQWAIEDPARWARWAVPCPVGAEEISQRKAARQRKARMDARTRERLPVLPVLAAAVDEHRKAAAGLLRSARLAEPGETVAVADQTLVRAFVTRPDPARVWVDDPGSGKRRDLAAEEDRAFWTWAAVEVLRHTGVRIEELLEITHHSLVRYRLPGTGELIPLLQITPSKTDTERLLVVSPELAEVLSAIISRVRDDRGAVPLVRAYDRHECQWLGPSPFLFQRRWAAQNRAICPGVIRSMLTAALAGTGLTDAAGQPLRYTPHDFRRILVHHGRDHERAAAAYRTDRRRPPGHQRHSRLQGRLPRRGDPGAPGVPGQTAGPAAVRGVPRPHRCRMGRVPWPLRAPQGRHRHLRPRIQHPLHPRAQLPAMQHALARPGPAAPHRRDPRQPHRPHHRSRTRRMARRSRRTQGQLGRRRRQTRPDRPPHPRRTRRSRPARSLAASLKPVTP
jgi:hypothetical protein